MRVFEPVGKSSSASYFLASIYYRVVRVKVKPQRKWGAYLLGGTPPLWGGEGGKLRFPR